MTITKPQRVNWFRPAILTVHIVRVLSEDVLVKRLSFVKLTQGLVKP